MKVLVKHRKVFCSSLLEPISLRKYLDTGLIKRVNVGGEITLTKDQIKRAEEIQRELEEIYK